MDISGLLLLAYACELRRRPFPCIHQGCINPATHGNEGRQYCRLHAPPGAKPQYGTPCSICGAAARYSFPGKRPERCFQHRLEGMRALIPGTCLTCGIKATHGPVGGKKISCGEHADKDHILLTYPTCKSPGCSRKANSSGHCSWHERKQYRH
jgi:hypothetical protein